MMKSASFDDFQKMPTTTAAQWLLGKTLVSTIGGEFCSGIIVETEAYLQNDKACHSFGNKKTARTAPMHGPSGHAYIFLCYGIHHLLNIVTQPEGIPEAILIRALEPLAGLDIMQLRTNKATSSMRVANGPGLVGKAMGIDRSMNNLALFGSEVIRIIDDGMVLNNEAIKSGPRIGVDYAGEDAELPYRYWIAGNKFVSR